MQPKQQAAEYKVLPDAHSDFVSTTSVDWVGTLAVIAVAVVGVLALFWVRSRFRS